MILFEIQVVRNFKNKCFKLNHFYSFSESRAKLYFRYVKTSEINKMHYILIFFTVAAQISIF